MKHNFGKGLCILPQNVFDQASKAVSDFNGLSILEVSHRSKDFVAVMDEAIDLVKQTMNVPAGYSVAFPRWQLSLGIWNFFCHQYVMRNGKAAYVNTGTWATKALKEAKKGSGFDVLTMPDLLEDKGFNYIPN